MLYLSLHILLTIPRNRYLVQFDSEKAPLLGEMNEIIFMFTNKIATLQVLEPRVMDLGERFNDLLFSLWKKLMLAEFILFEQCEVRCLK